jgi:hypothetical protein
MKAQYEKETKRKRTNPIPIGDKKKMAALREMK